MNSFEVACREWMKGCSDASAATPWKCEPCTQAFYARIVALDRAATVGTQWEPPKQGVRMCSEHGYIPTHHLECSICVAEAHEREAEQSVNKDTSDH